MLSKPYASQVIYPPNSTVQIELDALHEIKFQSATAAELRTKSTTNANFAVTFGAISPGDGGGGMWRWDPYSTATDNLGTVLLPTGHHGPGRWLRIYEDPVNVQWFGDSGTALQDAIDVSTNVMIPSGVICYVTSSVTISTPGTVLHGSGAIIPRYYADNTSAITISASNVTIKDITIDCSYFFTPSSYDNYVRGIATTEAPGTVLSDILIDNVTIQNTTFSGIDIYCDVMNTPKHYNISIRNCKVTNNGWCGISVISAKNLDISGNSVISTGWNAINVFGSCQNVRVERNYVNKSTKPTKIYDGPNGNDPDTETGGMIYISPLSKQIVIDGNNCYDNRRAGEDAIIVGEDGFTEFDQVVVSNNTVTYAGRFGIDAHSNFTVTSNNINYANVAGIFLSRDLGGVVRNVVVTGNVIRNVGYSAAHDNYGIQISSNQSAVNVTSDIIISNNVVSDIRMAPENPYTNYGIGIHTDYNTFNRVYVTDNNFYNVLTQSVIVYGDAPYTNNLIIRHNIVTNNLTSSNPPIISGATPVVYGIDYCYVANSAPTTMTNFIGGYVGQEIFFIFQDSNTTIELTGSAYFYGNRHQNYTMLSYQTARAVFSGDKWYWVFNYEYPVP